MATTARKMDRCPQASLTLIDESGKGVRTEGGLRVRARRVKVSSDTECLELYGPETGFVFLPDEGEYEWVGIAVDAVD